MSLWEGLLQNESTPKDTHLGVTHTSKATSNKTYRHLQLSDREEIAILRLQGKSLRHVAKMIGQSASTLSREIKRNGSPVNQTDYRAHIAERRRLDRFKTRYQRERIANLELRGKVTEQLEIGLSPELIAGRLRQQNYEYRISYKTIYQYIYMSARHLIPFLTYDNKTRRRRSSAKNKRAVKNTESNDDFRETSGGRSTH